MLRARVSNGGRVDPRQARCACVEDGDEPPIVRIPPKLVPYARANAWRLRMHASAMRSRGDTQAFSAAMVPFSKEEAAKITYEQTVLHELDARRAEARAAIYLGESVIYTADDCFWDISLTANKQSGDDKQLVTRMMRCGAGLLAMDARRNLLLQGPEEHEGSLLRPISELEGDAGADTWVVCGACHALVPSVRAEVCPECMAAARCEACAAAGRGAEHGCEKVRRAVEEAVANLRKRSTYPFVRMHYPPGKDSATKYRAVAVSALDALRGVPLATDILSEQTSLGTSAILRHPRLVARALLSDMVIHNWKLRGMRNDLYID